MFYNSFNYLTRNRSGLTISRLLGPALTSAYFFKINFFFWYFDPENIVLDSENKKNQVELTNVSAKKEPLALTPALCAKPACTFRAMAVMLYRQNHRQAAVGLWQHASCYEIACSHRRGMMMMYLFTTVPHPHGHWQLQELLGNQEQYYNWVAPDQWFCLQNEIIYFWDTFTPKTSFF